ncbi:radical SAM protein [Desulfobotulus sp. H1]|uniref:Radical SAM protein n=1 Tax=Desulfobotulus pelophilus TaxID=2823377 RepID=A0ABT3N8L1_9BACT|nr:radical SAM protein [Desulfobotulus pelophilus]MCW7753377.1 radical SAM protein [Desulfobotulus pelophilus]
MKDFLVLQIEPSTCCTLRCPTCPRTAFAQHWENRHLPMDQLHRILPLAARAEMVQIQGWGEPLCHPSIAAIVEAIQQTGTRCALTTNGSLLDEKRSRNLLTAGLSQLTVSVSGATQETHAALRPPSDLSAIMKNIRRFRELAKESGAACQLTLSFLQQDKNIHELAAVVAMAREYKMDDCLAINATYLPTPDHERQYVRPGLGTKWAGLRALWTSIRKAQNYISARVQPVEQAVCANDPLQCVFVGADGSVSPCIFLQLPLKPGCSGHPPFAIMGNLFEEEFDTLWNHTLYGQFREAFQVRRDFHEDLYKGIDNCSEGRRRLLEAPAIEKTFFDKHPVPQSCRACAKMNGL